MVKAEMVKAEMGKTQCNVEAEVKIYRSFPRLLERLELCRFPGVRRFGTTGSLELSMEEEYGDLDWVLLEPGDVDWVYLQPGHHLPCTRDSKRRGTWVDDQIKEKIES